MKKIFSKMLEREDIKSLTKEIVNNKHYNSLTVSLPFNNNYFMDNHYALFLVIDALMKFELIIKEENLVEEYISQLKRIINKMNNYQDISKGINLLISKTVAKLLNINNYKSPESKKKILRYVYEKYIVEGYFYYGLSSSNKNELDFSGIKKDGFILDSRLSEVNEILKKYENRDIIKRVESDITDNFVIACYFAFLGPDYLEKFATSGIFNHKSYDTSCFYTKDIHIFKENLEKYMSHKKVKPEERNMIINNLLEVWQEDDISNSHGYVALIKRSNLKRNYLKDIEEIIENSKEIDIIESMAMIMESRYTGYEIDRDISSLYLETVALPSYQNILGREEKKMIEEIETLDDIVPSEKEKVIYPTPKKSASYGYASILMLTGLLLISIGTTILIVISNLGR